MLDTSGIMCPNFQLLTGAASDLLLPHLKYGRESNKMRQKIQECLHAAAMGDLEDAAATRHDLVLRLLLAFCHRTSTRLSAGGGDKDAAFGHRLQRLLLGIEQFACAAPSGGARNLRQGMPHIQQPKYKFKI